MKNRILALLSVVFTTIPLAAADAAQPDPILERGRYLLEGVGLCADCHTPRNERGEFVMEHWLMGAKLDMAPTIPMPVWAPVAPPIAGLPSMTADEAVAFLMHGKRPDGTMPRPPMPAYRLNEEDARALVAYLKSLRDAPATVATR